MEDDFLITPTVQRNIREANFALRYSSILLKGVVGSGKTKLARHLAKVNNAFDSLIEITLDDTFDSKDLLGNFGATSTPGCFEWRAGPLTVAVETGRWVLIEDIDLASFDVFSALLPLLEKGQLYIAERKKYIQAHPKFRLIATQQITSVESLHRKGSAGKGNVNALLQLELWGSVIVHELPLEEQQKIVCSSFPHIPTSIVVSLIEQASQLAQYGLFYSLRDVLKWAQRCSKLSPVTSNTSGYITSTQRESMLREALDVYCVRVPPGKNRSLTLNAVAKACGVAENVCLAMVESHKPQFSLIEGGMQIGRIFLPRVCDETSGTQKVVFAETTQAMNLLERMSASVLMNEPVLLTGETGIGKTFLVQYLANSIGQRLIVHNVNQQTDSGDLMGGWKPQDAGKVMNILSQEFLLLFDKTFDAEKNAEFTAQFLGLFRRHSWKALYRMIEKGIQQAQKTLVRRSQQGLADQVLDQVWTSLKTKLEQATALVFADQRSVSFSFEEGTLVQAWREGHWILLDEVNLASSDVLERVASVIGSSDSLLITERGDTTAVKRHPGFRLFANMNPPTDVGKKDLPPSLRSRFTEFYVEEPLNPRDIAEVVSKYIGGLLATPPIQEIVDWYLEVRRLSATLTDPSADTRPPHYSLRTLTRALRYAKQATALHGFTVALYDGLGMGFASALSTKFHEVIDALIKRKIFKNITTLMTKLPKEPVDGRKYLPFEHLWIEAGPNAPFTDGKIIVTTSVRRHLKNIARAVVSGHPVLLEGPTSSGKSSMVQYLADQTGHSFTRINNHESTEVQEYLGQYVSDDQGKLRFVDGALVKAVKNGYWLVLDELNLAPTEVLEALNRLLDDNAELFVPDTQEVIKAHPQFRVFATQNPAGVYGGRKVLSRAFRNRFMEIMVDDIPSSELVEILTLRYELAPSFAQKMVEVMKKLQLRRQSSHLFAGRHGYLTPRDLFRWAERKPATYQELGEHGFLLLADRCRMAEERVVIRDTIEEIMKVELEETQLYHPSHWPFVKKYYQLLLDQSDVFAASYRIVWTRAMLRLFTTCGLCLEHKEPVLLIGETGSSKTTVCQIWAALLSIPLHIMNCHQHTEAADFLGALRPNPPSMRTEALFAWYDGPLVQCMRDGSLFVLDEIALAEDSVLERMNSVLEPGRKLTLAEKPVAEDVTAEESFRVMATMNPSGDFGKRELSPALRNRFTEIFVEPITQREDVMLIVSQRLPVSLQERYSAYLADILTASSQVIAKGRSISIRDIIALCDFMSLTVDSCDAEIAFVHGVDAVLIDGSGVGSSMATMTVTLFKETLFDMIKKMVSPRSIETLSLPFWEFCQGIEKPIEAEADKRSYSFSTPRTIKNLSKLFRGLVMPKALLLEGSPGVGKTSIVEALGRALGKTVVRINLSEQTDMMDLLGTFLPTGDGIKFSWCDGLLLKAVKEGSWVLLDELNLANQTVLEGLNALLDHRQSLFIPELSLDIKAHPNFRIFACQNPVGEGGSRKGLPRSFVNRFTRVQIEPYDREDYIIISKNLMASDIAEPLLLNMVNYVTLLHQEVNIHRAFGLRGGPFEFNLRDVIRWCELMRLYNVVNNPELFVPLLFLSRFHSHEDRREALLLFHGIFGADIQLSSTVYFHLSESDGQVFGNGQFLIARNNQVDEHFRKNPLLLLPSQSLLVQSVLQCAHQQQLAILLGSTSAKTSILLLAAALSGQSITTISMTAGSDTIDLLGGFTQKEGAQGQFVWQDSALVSSVIAGGWVVIENTNFCSPSVLDRLNPLVEPNGVLLMSEQGLVDGQARIITPHPNFRLFLTMDPKFGSISRAMRNRAVELHVDPIVVPSLDCDAVSVLNSLNSSATFEITALTAIIRTVHQQVLQKAYHTDAANPMSVSDALARGAPSVRTIASAMQMMSNEEKWEEMFYLLSHCYTRNRLGLSALIRNELEDSIRSLLSDDCLTAKTASSHSLSAKDIRAVSEFRDAADVDSIRIHQQGLFVTSMFRAAVDGELKSSRLTASLIHFMLNLCGSYCVISASCDKDDMKLKFALRDNASFSKFLKAFPDEVDYHKTLLNAAISWLQQFLPQMTSRVSNSSALLPSISAYFSSLNIFYHQVASDVAAKSIAVSQNVNSAYRNLLTAITHFFSEVPLINPQEALVFLPFLENAQKEWNNIGNNISRRNFIPSLTALFLVINSQRKYETMTLASQQQLLEHCYSFDASLRRFLDIPAYGVHVGSSLWRYNHPRPTTLQERQILIELRAVKENSDNARSPLSQILHRMHSSMVLQQELFLLNEIIASLQNSSLSSAEVDTLRRKLHEFMTLALGLEARLEPEIAPYRILEGLISTRQLKEARGIVAMLQLRVVSQTEVLSHGLSATSWLSDAIQAFSHIQGGKMEECSSESTVGKDIGLLKEFAGFFQNRLRVHDVAPMLLVAIEQDVQHSLRMMAAMTETLPPREDNVESLRDHLCRHSTEATFHSSLGLLNSYIALRSKVRSSNGDDSVSMVAVLMMMWGAWKANVLQPNGVIDPMYKRQMKIQVLSDALEQWKVTKSVFKEADGVCCIVSPQHALIGKAVDHLARRVSRSSAKYIARPDSSGQQFFAMSNFFKNTCVNFLQDNKLTHLANGIDHLSQPREGNENPKRKRVEKTADLSLQLKNELETFGTLASQMSNEAVAQFAGYEDFVTPLAISIFHASIGSRVCTAGMNPPAPHQQLLHLSFPPTLQLFFDDSACAKKQKLLSHLNLLDASLAQIMCCCEYYRGRLPEVDNVWKQYHEVYASIEEWDATANKDDALQVKYKEKVIHIEGDDEKHKRRLKEMFPNYEKLFEIVEEESTEEEAEDQPTTVAIEVGAAHRVGVYWKERNGTRLRALIEAHHSFYSNLQSVDSIHSTEWQVEEAIRIFVRKFDVISSQLHKQHVPRLPVSQEQALASGFAARALALKAELRQIQSASVSEDIRSRVAKGFNIYLEADPVEVTSASPSLLNLLNHVRQCQEEFPENVVLERLLKIGKRIAQLPVLVAPLMQVLSGFEILLRECYEWERNAAKHVSIMTHIDALATWILRWRRMELYCWPHIFVSRQHTFEGRAAFHWFHLHRKLSDCLIQVTPNYSEVLQELNAFLMSSNIGEFNARVQIIQSLGYEAASRIDSPHCVSFSRLFLHVGSLFFQFAKIVEDHRSHMLAPLREELSAFCRAMTWEDTTYYAVRATTEKSHLQVSRIFSKLEDCLNGQVKLVIEGSDAKNDEDHSMGVVMGDTVPKENVKVGAKRTRKGLKVSKEENEAGKCWHWHNRFVFGTLEFLDTNAERIIQEVTALQMPKVKQMAKARSLKLLFEKTSEAGIVQTQPESFPSLSALFSEAPVLGKPNTCEDFYKALRHLMGLRDEVNSHHQDLSTNQARRAVSMCSNLFLNLLSHRQFLSALSSIICELGDIRVQLCAKHSLPTNVCTDIRLISEIMSEMDNITFSFTQLVWCLKSSDFPPSAAALAVISTCQSLIQGLEQSMHGAGRKVLFISDCGVWVKQLQELQGQLQSLGKDYSEHCFAAPIESIDASVSRLIVKVAQVSSTSSHHQKKAGSPTWSQQLDQCLNSLESGLQKNTFENASIQAKIDALAEEVTKPSNGTGSNVYQLGFQKLAEAMENITSRQNDISSLASGSLPRDVTTSLQRQFSTRLDECLLRLQGLQTTTFSLYQSSSRFCFILCRLFHTLFLKGFCKSEDEEEDDDGEGGEEGTKEGTGMDDGQGQKDVTDQMENEDQLMNQKDMEKQNEEEKDGEDDKNNSKPAEVETNFEAGKEERDKEEGEDDHEESGSDNESEKEWDDVDPEAAEPDRKKARTEKKDQEDDQDAEDEGAQEIPEDEFQSEGSENEEGCINKEQEIKNKDKDSENEEGKSKEIIADGAIDDDEVSQSASDESKKDEKEGDEDNVDDEKKSQGSENDGMDKSEDVEDPNLQKTEEQQEMDHNEDEKSNGGEEDGSVEKNEFEYDKDENVHEGGQQDDRTGEEQTEAQDEQRERAEAKDAAGTEEQQGNEDQQEMSEAGRMWMRRKEEQKNNRKDSQSKSERKKSNPYKAVQEALRRYDRQLQQLNLDNRAKVKDKKMEGEEEQKGTDELKSDDEYEFDENAEQEGLAPVEKFEKPSAQQQPDLEEEQKEEEEVDEKKENDNAQKLRRKRHQMEEDDAEEEGNNENDQMKKSRKERKSKYVENKVKQETESNGDDDEPEGENQHENEDAQLARGRKMWMEQEAATSALSQQLCEQLRLILDPTVADRLQGDYKSGKRINIKKIIPYIASDYKKDRIWLRRTKASKRSYQVLIALDDSQSMAHNNAGLMSCQAVTLLCKALQQLEVGEFGLASFGKKVEIVHPLNQPFSNESGPQAFSKIGFQQQSTSMRLLLGNTLQYLDEERERLSAQSRSSSQQLLQLMFIISDGHLTEDRAELRKLVARAEANKQVIVLIILDVASKEESTAAVAEPEEKTEPRSNAEALRRRKEEREKRKQGNEKVNSSSVLDMQIVEFKGSNVLKKSYLDDFPFGFYLVVKDLERLPHILADAMKQWFEMMIRDT